MMLGRLLEAASTNLAVYVTVEGFRFLDAKIEIGSEIKTPSTVETNAILMVSTIPIHAVEQVKSIRG